jgi:hypothetical protein
MNSTNQYHIDGVYVSLAGLANGLIFPWAFIPPKGVSKHEFYRRVLVEEVVRLSNGVSVLHRGSAHASSSSACVSHHGRTATGKYVQVRGDWVVSIGDHPGLAWLLCRCGESARREAVVAMLSASCS